MQTQFEAAKHLLFSQEGLDVSNVKMFPGSDREVTPEQMSDQIVRAVAQINAGDYDVMEFGDE